MEAGPSTEPETARRELRRRTPQQPYRPRPALTSSNRGKANAELRRRKELEANLTFAEANELIGNIKGGAVGACSSSFEVAMSEVDEERQDEEQSIEADGDTQKSAQNNSFERAQNDSGVTQTNEEAQRDDRVSEEMRDERDVTLELGADTCDLLPESSQENCATPTIERQVVKEKTSGPLLNLEGWGMSSQEQDVDNIDRISGAQEQSKEYMQGDTQFELTQSQSVITALPPVAKRVRIEYQHDLDDEFDTAEDENFYEQLAASDAIDWDSRLSSTSNATATATAIVNNDESLNDHDVYKVIMKNREAYPETNGFRWGNEKEVQLAIKAIESAQHLVQKIKRDTDAMESPYDFGPSPSQTSQSPQPTPRRVALGPISRSRLNMQVSSPSPSAIQSSNLGKRKLPTEQERNEEPTTPFRPSSSFAVNKPDQVTSQSINSSSFQTPSRARGTVRLGTTIRSTPFRSTPMSSTPNPATTGAPRTPRISLGMTPRRSTSGSVPRFKTPFKDPSQRNQPSGCSQRSPELSKLLLASSRGVPSPFGEGGGFMTTPKLVTSHQAIFDLNKSGLERKTYRSLAFVPENTPDGQVRQKLNVEEYDSIRQILNEPQKARCFAFEIEGGYFGVSSAHAMLLEKSSTSGGDVPRRWVENHYTLILWKLAAYTRTLLDDRYWNWTEVCRQLKYRYEREINLLQRSAINRIFRQERPSTAAMILCVFETPATNSEEEGEAQSIVLTDGWYKIRATVDSVLAKAIQKGQTNTPLDQTSGPSIKVGTKLAIQGAQIDAEAVSRDPIKAFEYASLTIGANSAKLAKWDAKLGFVQKPFAATIRSLSALGGNIPLMDIVISRLFPPAYTGNDICPGYKGERGVLAEWGEAEERERRKSWEQHQKEMTSEIQEELESKIKPLKQIVEQLEEAYEGLDGSYDNCEFLLWTGVDKC